MSTEIAQIGSYRLLGIIGQGGTSTIYHAVHVDTRQDVALKVLNPQAALDPAYVRRFLKESKNIQRLQHSNIVKIFDADESNGFHYIAMELITGGSLADYLKKQNQLISPEQALQILYQAAAGFDHAHQLDILHRDIKLSNLLIAEDGTTLIVRFWFSQKHVTRCHNGHPGRFFNWYANFYVIRTSTRRWKDRSTQRHI